MSPCTKVFAFDFDLTLTDEHSRGHPDADSNLYLSKSNHDNIGAMLQRIADDPTKCLFLISRGIKTKLEDYLKAQTIPDGRSWLQLFDSVYGARDASHLNKGRDAWVKIKQDLLKEIRKVTSTKPNNVSKQPSPSG